MTIPTQMSGWQLTHHGGPEALVWNENISLTPPKNGEVLVRVLAAGVNNTDINTRIGWYSSDVTASTEAVDTTTEIASGGWSGALPFPLVQGGDLCGEVVAIGDDVEDFLPGMRVACPNVQANPSPEAPTRYYVIGSEYDGAFAQYCTIPADQTWDVSASPLSDVEIAALPCAYGTALNLLTRADVRAKDRVLITGASGGVGMAAVQMAKLKGAEITGVSSSQKQQAVRQAGADHVIDRGDMPQAEAYTVVIDVVGGDAWPNLIAALKPAGRYAVSGAIAGPMVQADLRDIYLKDISIFGCTYQPREVFAELVSMIISASIKPLISKTYPLQELKQAQEDFLSKRYPGKLVLIPEATP